MEREGKNAGMSSEAFPHLEFEYPRRSQQRSGHSGQRRVGHGDRKLFLEEAVVSCAVGGCGEQKSNHWI